jgi:hypothetical protein
MNANNRFSLGRRKVLFGAAGAAALGVFGAFAWSPVKNYRATWIEQVVRDNLPGINLDPGSLQTFVSYMLGHERMRPPLVKATIFADRFVPWLPAHITKARKGLAGVERHVLTEYLIGSNFFRVREPRHEVITYHGPVIACINPFVHGYESTFSGA